MNGIATLFLVVFVVGVVHGQETEQPPLLPPDGIVDIPELGKIQGLKWWTSTTLRPFIVFHGIPYAKAPTGPLRFKPSVMFEGPLTADGSTFLAIDPLIVCPQGLLTSSKAKHFDRTNANLLNVIKSGLWKWTQEVNEEEKSEPNPLIGETEDCLVLNINTPKIPQPGEENPKFPVIFFIHGGSSTQIWGAPFTGFRFLEHDVILVTINYRLGVLGALNLGIDDAPGNAAMYDCLTALDWVHENIHHFGGDKDRIVIYGHSAGSMMVSHLLLSPLAAGKFSGVIGSSGSALSPWGTAEEQSLSHHLEVAALAGCPVPPGVPVDEALLREVYECLLPLDESVLRGALNEYSSDKESKGGLGFDAKVPSVQNSPFIKTTPKFLAEMPHRIVEKHEQNPVNLIMGANRHDGSFALDGIYRKYLVHQNLLDDKSFMRNDLIPVLMKTMRAKDYSGAFAHILTKTYFGDGILNGEFEEMLAGLIDVTSIWGFKAPAYELVERHAAVNPNSFYYAFDFDGFWSTCDMGGSSNIPCGVPHIDDMSFVFQIFPLINDDLKVSQRMVQYFVNFATYGNPNGPDTFKDLLYWPPYDPLTHPFLKIDKEDSIGTECRAQWIDNALEIIPK